MVHRPYHANLLRATIAMEVNAMTKLSKRETRPVDLFGRLFDDWWTDFPVWRPAFLWREFPDMIRVDEFRENGTLVVRAELPGIDPDKDVDVTVSDGTLHIRAERREEDDVEERGYVRHELRRGTFERELPLPEGASDTDVVATYTDGILEIRVPVAAVTPPAATKVPVTKS
jgi:HSP20 family protein